jgi:D-serine deaminase-like pyridoxal phosphate-dependent protein
VFAQHGIGDILLTNQVIGQHKLARLAQLAQTTRLGVLVDGLAQIKALGQAMAGQRAKLDVYIEVEVGGKRCGVDAALAGELACAITAHENLNFAGLQCYHGAAQHLRQPDARAGAIANAAQVARRAVQSVQAAGLAAPLVTGAGTGTFWLERDCGVYGEIQPGSYALMDRDYADNTPGSQDVRFEHALWIKSSVTSVAQEGFVVIDAGRVSQVDVPRAIYERPANAFVADFIGESA